MRQARPVCFSALRTLRIIFRHSSSESCAQLMRAQSAPRRITSRTQAQSDAASVGKVTMMRTSRRPFGLPSKVLAWRRRIPWPSVKCRSEGGS
jgi:hypothetical protein